MIEFDKKKSEIEGNFKVLEGENHKLNEEIKKNQMELDKIKEKVRILYLTFSY
jgi:hypothetical protein